jgi:hypothetical protein
MTEFLETSFSGTSLPASMLLSLVLVYWLFVIFGALDLDMFDFDLEIDADLDVDSVLSLGFAPLRFLNLGRIPLMLWMSIFSLSWWGLSRVFTDLWILEEGTEIGLLIARDVGLALVATKLITNPLRGKFDLKEPHKAAKLIGGTCVMLTGEVTASAGQAEYETEGAPLKLNVRATGETLAKGDVGEIVDYDPENNIYLVTKTERET